MIHSVGDSHAQWTFKRVSSVEFHEIGPVTMDSVGKERAGTTSQALLDLILRNLGIQESDTVIMCFGEIDVRCLVQPRVDAGENEDEVLAGLVHSYLTTINQSKYKNIWVLSITPPWGLASWTTFIDAQPNRCVADEQWPLRGTDEERSRYTTKVNALLKAGCDERNVPFLSVYDHYCDESGMLIPSLSDGTLHIGNCASVQLELDAMLQRLSTP